MKQVAQSLKDGKIEILDVPPPEAPARGYLVRVSRSVVSPGTERMTSELAKKSIVGKAIERPDLVRKVVSKVMTDGLRGAMDAISARLDQPAPVGYSVAGVVERVGREVVDGFRPGDRVACAGAGIANHAELVAVPKLLAARVPEGVSDEDAAFGTLGAISLQGVRILEPSLGEVVVVIGLGLLGQFAAQLARAAGCRVVGLDPVASRGELALSLGIDAVTTRSEEVEAFLTKLGAPLGADGVLVCAATKSDEPLRLAASFCRKKGRISLVGAVGMNLDRRELYTKELDLRMSTSYGPGRYDPQYESAGIDYPLPYVRWTEQRNIASFLDLVAGGRVRCAPLVTHRFPVDRVAEAYDLLGSREAVPLGIVLSYAPSKEESRVVSLGAAPPSSSAAKSGGIGVVGAGVFARTTLLPILKAEGAPLVAISSERGLTARASGERFGFRRAVAGAADVIGDPEVGSVFVLTTHEHHARLAADALRAGKAVFVEKPLALSSAELDEVVEALGASGRLTVGFNRRFAPAVLEVANLFRGVPGPVTVTMRVNSGPLPADSWQLDPKVGGGRLLGEGCHFVDLASFLLRDPVRRVYATAGGKPGRESIQIVLEAEGGSSATIGYHAIGDSSLPKELIEVSAGGRSARIDDFRILTTWTGGKCRVRKAWSRDKGHRALLQAFLAYAKGVGAAPIPIADLVASTRATLAAAESVAGGVPVELPPAGRA
jgi:polar amino acid transport system substrate-binding protein